ncbi:sulfurtransferase complex subunit TusD [Entomomonas asaccharolytica]|uniref:Sulfurtransferase complex subunit TusD n=1 Tax=Entomomonas asaccharolytica TaxID=2785331 RepID=A0A974RWF8_9GAMM|nr:sulfurtransferase complex subunit TusD [Entomomonas asaccharolytica]QQP85102.1 sulfurtransferase complex subunit TusD [Entomomonas asaccharolytica]
MKFTIAIYCPPQSPASRRALRFTQTVLQTGHTIERLFFYQQGIYNAISSIVTPQDEFDIHLAWQTLIEENNLDAVVCIAAALRRGQLDKTEAKRYQKTAITILPPWQLSGLGQLHEAIQNSDRFICFGGNA